MLPVSPSFFRTTGMTVIRGRPFREDENRLDAPPVVVINEALAKAYFPGQDPLGKHLTFGFMHTASASPSDTVRARGEIVGIVHDAHFGSLDKSPEPATFLPFRTEPFSATFLLRTSIEPSALANEVRRVVAGADRDVPIYELGTMDDDLSMTLSRWRFYTVLLTAFAAVALLLATLGIYGVVSYSVSQETREFGIRIALGARSRDVVYLVLGRSVSLILPGLAVGVIGALFVTRLVRVLLFGVEPLDQPTFALACLLFASVGTIASWVPARRAARVDPIVAMRAE